MIEVSVYTLAGSSCAYTLPQYLQVYPQNTGFICWKTQILQHYLLQLCLKLVIAVAVDCEVTILHHS